MLLLSLGHSVVVGWAKKGSKGKKNCVHQKMTMWKLKLSMFVSSNMGDLGFSIYSNTRFGKPENHIAFDEGCGGFWSLGFWGGEGDVVLKRPKDFSGSSFSLEFSERAGEMT